MSDELVLILINILVIPLLVELYNLVRNQFNFQPSKFHISIVLTAVAVAISLFFGEDFFAGLPSFQDGILEFAIAVINGLGALAGVALLLYHTLYDKFFDVIGQRVKLFAYRLR
jgi:hypothetical protein